MDSRGIVRAALNMTLSPSREAEQVMKEQLTADGIHTTAVGYGWEFHALLIQAAGWSGHCLQARTYINEPTIMPKERSRV